MLFTSHAITGAAIGLASGNPYAGFAGGVLSHHLLDMIPHFDQGTFRLENSRAPYAGMPAEYKHLRFIRRDWVMLFIDWAVSGMLFLIIFTSFPVALWPLIFFGALGGITPDIIGSSPLWSDQLEKKYRPAKIYRAFHSFFHFTVSPSFIWLGIATQILIVGYSLILIAG